MMLLTGAEDEPICKRVSSGGDLAFDASQLSFIEECTEEMEYEFTESRDSLTDLPSSHTYRKELPLKDGFLFVLSDDYEWFRLYVAVYSKHLDAYHNILDPLPGISVNISTLTQVRLQSPCQFKAQMPDQQLFPFAVINTIARREALAVPRPSRTPTASTGSLGNLQGTSGPQGFFDPIIPLRPQNTPSQLQLAAQTRHEADEWVAAIQSRISASSLDIEGLNLEGCSSYVPIESASDHHGAISQTLQLLDELLRETPVVMETNANTGNGGNAKEPVANATMCAGVVGGQGAAASAVGADVAPQLQAKAQLQNTVSTPAGDDIAAGAKPKLHTSWSEEEREQHASIMAHQQALRRATHLRQRKISTELKLETIQKQLRRTKKAQPKAIPEEGNDRSAFEEQLQELTETLKTLEGNLGQTELEAQKTKRNWDSKMEEVYKHIYDPATILNIDQWAERKNTSGRASTRRIGGGSLRVRAAKFIQSPRPRKKPHDTNTNGGSKDGSGNNNNNSNNGQNFDHKHGGGGGSNVEDSDTDEKSSGARTLGAKQGRRGTFRVFGSLLDSKRGRFGGSGKQQQPYGSGQGQQQQGKDGHVTSNFGGLKQKAEATSSSMAEQDKERAEKQDSNSDQRGAQAISSQENTRPAMVSAGTGGQENTPGTGRTPSAPLNLTNSPRSEIPRWVVEEIELFEQLIRDYQKVHGKVVDIFET